MVNGAVTAAYGTERVLVLLHVPARARPAVTALLMLHDRLAHLATSGSEPMLRRIRLAWWRDALVALDDGPPPAEPTLAAVAGSVLQAGVSGAALAGIAEGWDDLVSEGGDADGLTQFADRAGGTFFLVLATVLGSADAAVRAAGTGWVLAEAASRLPPGELASRVASAARQRLDDASRPRWPRRLRALAMLAALARDDLRGGAPGTPARAALLWRIRLFGR